MTMQNLVVVVSRTVCVHVGGPKNFGDDGAEMGHGWRPINTLLPKLVNIGFRRSRSNRLVVGRESTKIWGMLEPSPRGIRGRGSPFRNTLLYHLCYHAKFGYSRSNHTSVLMENRKKNLTARVPPFNVIGSETDR